MVKLEISNSNYAATVVKVRHTQSLQGLDRLVGLSFFGCTALVSKDTQAGSLGILFTAGTQLSEDFCHHNNMFRHKEKNKDQEKVGYIEDNRRVKAIKFRGNPSSALFVSIDSLAYLGVDVSKLKEGDIFTSIDGVEVCRKFVLKQRGVSRANKIRNPQFCRVEPKLFPEHFDTENWWKNEHKIGEDETIIVTQKLHGTSVRFTRQAVSRKPTIVDRIANFFGACIAKKEYANLVGTRRTIRDPEVETFYEQDVWMEHMDYLVPILPKNWVVYGEIIGWAGGSKIQHNYDYRHAQGQSSLYVYRIAVVNEDGISVDVSWDGVRKWCDENGLQAVPELWRGKKSDFNVDMYLNTRYVETLAISNAVPLSDESPCDEGVCVRVEGLTPYVLKAKSPAFLEYESGAADKEIVDIEEEQGALS